MIIVEKSSLPGNNLFRVYNIAGSLVGAFAAADGSRADLSELSAGICFIREHDGGAVVKYVKR